MIREIITKVASGGGGRVTRKGHEGISRTEIFYILFGMRVCQNSSQFLT